MSEERIQEIKDSINFQYELIVSKGIDKSALLFTDEEQELLEEVERLHSIIKEVREYIKKEVKVYYVLDTKLNEAFDKTNKVKEDILEILDKAGDEK